MIRIAFLVFALCLTPFQLSLGQEAPAKLKIFILAGQSNMEGKGSVYTMKHQLTVPDKRDRFDQYMNGDSFAERDDVWIDYLGGRGQRFGKLTVGYGVSQDGSFDWFGPELGFGWTIGDHFDDPVLIIKTAWGGKSIDRDFRPPSRGIPESAKEQLANRQKKNPELTKEEFEKGYGHFYRQMTDEIKKVTSDLKTYVPDYQDQGYEFAGFVWFQGWNDQYAPTSVEDYKDNLVGLINDLRKEVNAPNMPVVIGAMGHNGEKQAGKIKEIADAQFAVSQVEELGAMLRRSVPQLSGTPKPKKPINSIGPTRQLVTSTSGESSATTEGITILVRPSFSVRLESRLAIR